MTTARFFDQCRHWFDLMSSRNPTMAISKFKDGEYEKTASFLRDSIELITGLKVGSGGKYKPFQSGMLLATHNVLSIAQDLVGQDKILFLLTSRFSQDCLENVFSSVRLKNPTPTPLEFCKNLRCVLVAHYLRVPSRSNYDADDRHFLGDLLQLPPIRDTCSEYF